MVYVNNKENFLRNVSSSVLTAQILEKFGIRGNLLYNT